jgi:site-specific DNA-methyltransferase (adenine-specific)
MNPYYLQRFREHVLRIAKERGVPLPSLSGEPVTARVHQGLRRLQEELTREKYPDMAIQAGVQQAPVTLYQGDCLDVMRAMPAGSVDLIVTSPPYNCRKQYGGFDDQVPWPDYYRHLGLVLDHCYRVLVDGGVLAIVVPPVVRWQSQHRFAHTWSDYDPHYATHRDDKRVQGKGRIEPLGLNVFAMMWQRDAHMREPIVWVKGREQPICGQRCAGSDSDPFCRPAHEWIVVGSKGRWFHRGGTCRRGRRAVPHLDDSKDVWLIPPTSSKEHPAPFPVEIPRRLIRLFTQADNAVVLDPYMGSGTTGLACLELGRRFIGIDNQARYVALAERRLRAAV